MTTSTPCDDGKPVRNFLDVGAGDRVEWHVEDGKIVVRKLEFE